MNNPKLIRSDVRKKAVDSSVAVKTVQRTGRRDADPWFDDLAARAAIRCDAPIALITIRTPRLRRVVAGYGMPDLVGRPVDLSMCAAAVKHPDRMLVVPDVSADARFAGDPFVLGDAKVRFYLGIPLKIKGEVIGTLCVMDRVERNVTFMQRWTLKRLAWRAALALDVRRIEAKTSGGVGIIF